MMIASPRFQAITGPAGAAYSFTAPVIDET